MGIREKKKIEREKSTINSQASQYIVSTFYIIISFATAIPKLPAFRYLYLPVKITNVHG